MSNDSKENKMLKESCVFRGENNICGIRHYLEHIDYFMVKFDKPYDRMLYLRSLMPGMKLDLYGRNGLFMPDNKKKVIRLLMNSDYQMRTKEYDKSDMICPDERYEFCFWDTLSPYPYCEYRYVSRYIMCDGAKHYVIDCSLSIFNEKESIIKFCNALIGLFNDGEFRYDGLGKLELPDFDPTEPFHIEDSEPLESDSTKYGRYLMDGERRKAKKVETGGHVVKFDVENTCKFWLAKDKDGGCFCYISKPIRDNIRGQWISVKSWLPIDNKFFPELKWEDEPLEVMLTPVVKS